MSLYHLGFRFPTSEPPIELRTSSSCPPKCPLDPSVRLWECASLLWDAPKNVQSGEWGAWLCSDFTQEDIDSGRVLFSALGNAAPDWLALMAVAGELERPVKLHVAVRKESDTSALRMAR